MDQDILADILGKDNFKQALESSVVKKDIARVRILSQLNKTEFLDQAVIQGLFQSRDPDLWTVLGVIYYPLDMDANKMISEDQILELVSKGVNPTGALVSARYRWGSLLEKMNSMEFVPEFMTFWPIVWRLRDREESSTWATLKRKMEILLTDGSKETAVV